VVEDAGPPLVVALQNHLGIRLRSETPAESLEVGTDGGEVEDLAVEGDPDRIAIQLHRLRGPIREVQDRQARVAEDN
jgi:hypothetical protein